MATISLTLPPTRTVAPAPTAAATAAATAAPAAFAVIITASRYGLVSATTSAGASCTVRTVLPWGNVSEAQGLQGAQTASASGTVSWSYRTVASTRAGTGTHTVTCAYKGQTRNASAPFTVP